MNERELRLLRKLILELSLLREEVRLVNEKNKEHNDDAHKKQRGSKQKDYVVQPTIRSVVEFPPDLIRNYQSANDAAHRQNRRDAAAVRINIGVQRRIVCAAWWAFGAAVVYAAITAILAIVAARQWQDLRHNFRVDQRAWARVHFGWPDTPLAACKVIINNVGKSPAISARTYAVLEVLTGKAAPSFSFTTPHASNISALLFPNDLPAETPVERFNDKSIAAPLTDKEIKDLSDGTSYMAVFGYVVYEDQFGTHWTRFCDWKAYSELFSGHRDFTAKSCVDWNAVGDGTPSEK